MMTGSEIDGSRGFKSSPLHQPVRFRAALRREGGGSRLQIPHCESAIASTFSQINGCAYGIDMHSKDARAEGETEQRLYVLRSWRETPFLYRSRARGAGLDRRVTLITK